MDGICAYKEREKQMKKYRRLMIDGGGDAVIEEDMKCFKVGTSWKFELMWENNKFERRRM